MFIEPMLLETAPGPFSHSQYIFEPKVDGHRLVFDQEAGRVRLFTRHHNDCTSRYPELVHPFENDITLDGEVACVDPSTGVSDFESVMMRLKTGKHDRIQRLTKTLPATFVIFDILRYRGKDLRSLPLVQRKEILSGIKLPSKAFGIMPFIESEGESLFAQIQRMKMEGIVGKRKDSRYVSQRSAAWQKVINWTYEEVYLTGYRKDEFGWLAAVPDLSGKLRPAGIIEFGTGPKDRKDFYIKSQRLETGEDKSFVYLKPEIRAEVKIRNWTKAGLLRDPVFTRFIIN
ncbi:ATP-dependent DNA ligase [Paenibacillus cellulositrophicus]|uniref:ATP-dependent DNA ligase n=1 Tax=Paenibacillus cellulositrophicus TaxID=562959 RepID=UPI003D99E171